MLTIQHFIDGRHVDAASGQWFDKTDPARSANRDKLLYYRDYGYEGELKLGDFIVVGRWQRSELFALAMEDSVGHQHMVVRMEQQGRREILHEGYCSRARFLDAELPRAPSLEGEDGADEGAQRGTQPPSPP